MPTGYFSPRFCWRLCQADRVKSWRAFLLLLLLVWGAAGLCAKPVDALRSSRDYDGLGSVRYLVDDAGLVVYELKTHAIGNLMQSAWTETVTDAGSMEAAAESALSVARTSVRQLLKEAKETLKQLGRLTATVKVVPMPKSIIPAVANHVSTAQSMGYPGFPTPLVRVTPAQKNLNRRAALAQVRGQSPGLGNSWDEYPFASSAQGGAGAHMAPVPWLQNCIQGGIISGAYKIEKITPGTPYLVIVTP